MLTCLVVAAALLIGAPPPERIVDIQVHGNVLTATMFMDDPVYLTEPYVLSRAYNLSTNPVSIGGPPCIVGDAASRGAGGLGRSVDETAPGMGPGDGAGGARLV